MHYKIRPTNPGTGYRYVCIGEVCQLGDEVLHEWRGPWRQVIRLTAVTGDDPPVRRKLPSTDAVDICATPGCHKWYLRLFGKPGFTCKQCGAHKEQNT